MNFNYRPITQTILHDPENGKIGNCFPAVLASILGCEIEDVPHFYNEPRDDIRKVETRIWQWLLSKGVNQIKFAFYGSPMETLKWMGQVNPSLTWVMSAVSPRNPEENHVVICDGGEFLWDPHPDRTFLKEARDGWTWIYVFAPCPEGAPS